MAEFQYDPSFRVNDDLARELLSLTEEGALADLSQEDEAGEEQRASFPLRDADAVVAHIEVNQRHGVGVLLERLFGHYPNIFSIRSQNHFGGRQEFGDLDTCLAHENTARDAVREKVRKVLADHTIGRILSVPYYADDVRNTLALKDITGAPLATYLMDDQNVCAEVIPDELMDELLARSDLRLAISPELATAYEVKYGRKFWMMPPVIPAHHILARPLAEEEVMGEPRTGVILGNIWGQAWLDALRETVRGSGIELSWYSTNHLRYLSGAPDDLARDGIHIPPGPPLPDPELVDVLRKTAFVVVPSGTLRASDDRRFIAQLSLPSRIPFVMSTSHTPFLVLGSGQTGAAQFVQELGVGLVSPYETAAFRTAVREITRPAANLRMRRRALALAGRFTDAGAAEWIWQSLERREPFDRRYEDLMRKPRPAVEEIARQRKKSS